MRGPGPASTRLVPRYQETSERHKKWFDAAADRALQQNRVLPGSLECTDNWKPWQNEDRQDPRKHENRSARHGTATDQLETRIYFFYILIIEKKQTDFVIIQNFTMMGIAVVVVMVGVFWWWWWWW